jgi:hypothetical protein
MTRALVTLEELKARLQAARAFQVWVEDHTALEDHDTSTAVAEAREATDTALMAVLDELRPRMP